MKDPDLETGLLSSYAFPSELSSALSPALSSDTEDWLEIGTLENPTLVAPWDGLLVLELCCGSLLELEVLLLITLPELVSSFGVIIGIAGGVLIMKKKN